MESTNCLSKETEVNGEGQIRNVEFQLGLTLDREVKQRSTLQAPSNPCVPGRENQHELDSKYWDDSVARVTSQLKEKLGVRPGCCEKAMGKPNGYWLGPLNGENGFTKLDNHVWSGEKREHHHDGETHNASSDLENASDAPGRSKASKKEQHISSPSSLTSLENFQGYDKSASVSETQSAGQDSCEEGTSRGKSGPLSYSYVNLENSTSVAVVKPKPKVHVANLVTSPPSPGPSSSLPPTASLCTYRNNVQCDADEIHYVAYESELQMPDIMRLIQKDLSEPYSIYTYRYFIHNWPKLCFLAMDSDKCVGAIVCKLDLHKNIVRRGYIAMLAVDENYRKRKIGSNLVLKAIQAMVLDDADEVVLETEISNKPALRLYENLGFVRDKRLFRYYLNGVDALRLKLWLR